MEPKKSFLASPFSSLLIIFLIVTSLCELNASSSEKQHRHVVKRSQRRTLFDTEYGEISAIDVKDGHETLHYHLQFFTLEPNSVFLPVLLHASMVFYVHTGSGKLTCTNEDGTSTIDIREGDICSLSEGSIFYIHSNMEAQSNKLRINAMFTNTDDSTFDPSVGAYSRINELLKGFDKKIIQAAFKVPEDLVEEITNKSETQAIVHAVPEKKNNSVFELEASFLKYFIGIKSNSKKFKTYNIFDKDPDFKNCYGSTITVTKKQLKPLKRHNIGFLMVNLTMGSMLGPHWNPLATEVAVVLEGEGMVRVVCGSNNDDDECENTRFRVKEGDVFVVPRFHPMAQMSFDKEPLVFMEFSTGAKKTHPNFLAGKGSVLQILDKDIVATSLGVSKTTIDQLLDSPDDSIIFECRGCAEEEERLMEEEKEKEEEEEEKEEEGKREEEEKERGRRRKREEEEVRRREEERKREEEVRRQHEKRERRREEGEARTEEERREREEAEAKTDSERGGRGSRQRREETSTEWDEEEVARRQQEERERRREQDSGSIFEGRRVLKIRKSV